MIGERETAIVELARVVAAQYLAEHDDDSLVNDSDEFISAIEMEIRSTLRNEIAKIATLRQASETPTLDPSSSSGMDLTMDSPLSPVASNGSDAASQPADLDVTLDPSDASELSDLSVDSPTLDGAKSEAVDIQPSNRPAPAVRSGTAKSKSGSRSTKAMSPPPGYQIISTLGKGGMGVVYKARHIPLDRTVAVKMIISGEHASDDQIRRFQKEAEAAANLSHPNIVSVYEVGEHQGLPFFSLEFVDGPSLSEQLKETTLSAKEAAEVMLPIARAIDYSHQRGILHRDLKPQNILLTPDGVPKVADFGLAKRLDATDSQTMTGVVVGTPGYLAPEQAADTRKVGPQTDVYALGCILYCIMTGRPPFKAPTPVETVRQLLFDEPLPPSRLQTGLDKDLETICMMALEKEIPKRYQSAGALADELERYLKGEPIVARPITRKERFWKWCKRNPGVALLSGLAASLLTFLLFGGITSAIVINAQKGREQEARRSAESFAELAEQNKNLAKDQAELALNTNRVVLYKTKSFFAEHPELVPLRKSMLDSIVTDIEKIHEDRYTSGSTATLRAAATSQLGQIYLDTGNYERAIQSLLAAEEQLKVLNREGKLSRARESQMDLGIAIGDTYREMADFTKAEERYLRVLAQRQKYFDDSINVKPLMKQQGMAEVWGRLQKVYQDLGKPERMLKYALLSTEARRAWHREHPQSLLAMEELVGALGELSVAYETSGDLDKMIEASGEMLGLLTIISSNKSDMRTMHNTAMSQKKLGRQSLVMGNAQRAAQLLKESTESFERLLQIASDNQQTNEQAADTYYYYGLALRLNGKDAQAAFQRAVEIQKGIVAKADNIRTRGMLLKIYARAGIVNEAKPLLQSIAAKPESDQNCGYAAVGYAMLAEHLPDGEQAEAVKMGIDFTRRLIRHGYHGFESMRKTDLDFRPLQDNPDFQAMLSEEQARVIAAQKTNQGNPQ